MDEELPRFDDHMNHVRGLAPSTRKTNLCFIRRLLLGQFGNQAVVISAILPDHMRQFVAGQSKLCKVTTMPIRLSQVCLSWHNLTHARLPQDTHGVPTVLPR